MLKSVSFIERVRDAGKKPALTLKPDCTIESLDAYIADLDMVLVMSVFPGFSGQSYIEGSEDRVAHVAHVASKENPLLLIEVDGGIKCFSNCWFGLREGRRCSCCRLGCFCCTKS